MRHPYIIRLGEFSFGDLRIRHKERSVAPDNGVMILRFGVLDHLALGIDPLRLVLLGELVDQLVGRVAEREYVHLLVGIVVRVVIGLQSGGRYGCGSRHGRSARHGAGREIAHDAVTYIIIVDVGQHQQQRTDLILAVLPHFRAARRTSVGLGIGLASRSVGRWQCDVHTHVNRVLSAIREGGGNFGFVRALVVTSGKHAHSKHAGKDFTADFHFSILIYRYYFPILSICRKASAASAMPPDFAISN